jgi:hypothetical protein
MRANAMPNGITTFVNMIAIGLPIYSNLINRAGAQKTPANTIMIINLITNLPNPLPND